jgi:hypothetical protein
LEEEVGVELEVEVEVEVEAVRTGPSRVQTATLGRWTKPGKGCSWRLLMKRKIICAESFLHSLAQVRSVTSIISCRYVMASVVVLGRNTSELCFTLAAFNDVAAASVGDGGSDEDHGQFSDSEWEASDSVAPSNIHIPVVSKALSSLMGLYASESEGKTIS